MSLTDQVAVEALHFTDGKASRLQLLMVKSPIPGLYTL